MYWLYDLKTGDSHGPYENPCRGGHPSFSPDGEYFGNDLSVSDSSDAGWRYEIRLYSMGERKTWLLAHPKVTYVGGMYTTHTFATQAHPVWSQDSRYLFFNSDESGVSQVYVSVIEEALGA